MLYCTCSVFKSEGQTQIDAFMQRRHDAAPVHDPASPGHLLPLSDNDSPLDHPAHAPAYTSPGDGFFYALIEKRPV
jgi:16S rRNA (cytosine967-C5)-methyltransferase